MANREPVNIRNECLAHVGDGAVRFAYKDYADGKRKVNGLTAAKILRRFLPHVLPPGFPRVRHVCRNLG